MKLVAPTYRMRCPVRSPLIVMWLALLVLGGHAAAEPYRTNLPAPAGTMLTVDINGGSIEVAVQDRREIRMEVERSARGRSSQRERELLSRSPLEFQHEGDEWKIMTTTPKSDPELPDGARPPLGGAFKFWVPGDCRLDLKTLLGTVEVSGLKADVRVQAVSGSLRFSEVRGTIRSETGSGSIQVRDCTGTNSFISRGGGVAVTGGSGELRVESGGGTLLIREFRGRVSAETAAGGIRFDRVMGAIEGTTGTGRIVADVPNPVPGLIHLDATGGGGIAVNLPHGTGFDLDAETSSGSVVVSTGAPKGPAGPAESRREKINGGGPEVKLRAGAGMIHVTATNTVPHTNAVPASKP